MIDQSVRFSAPSGRWRGQVTKVLSAALIMSGFGAYASFYCVPEGFSAIVTRFGNPVREIADAGPYWKLPGPIDRVHLIDRRKQLLDVPPMTTFTRDKKTIVLKAFVVWHVADPLRFLQAAENTEWAATNLSGMVTSANNQEISRHDLSAIVSTNPQEIRINEVESQIVERVQRISLAGLGIAIDKVGFQRVTLPAENVAAVLERMRAEREAEAGRLRSEGAKLAQAIRDEAHVKSQTLLQKSREEASRITAAAEMRAGEMFAAAQGENPEFFRFWTSLQASKQALGKNSVLILRSDLAFFDALLQPSNSNSPSNTAPPLTGGPPAVHGPTIRATSSSPETAP